MKMLKGLSVYTLVVVMVIGMVVIGVHFWSGCTLRVEEMRTSRVLHLVC